MWLFQRLRSATSQQDDQQQHADSKLQSDSSADNDKQAQVLAKGLQNLAVSTKDGVIDRYIQGQSVVIDEEEQVKQAADEDHRHLVVKAAVNEAFQAKSLSESESKSHWDVNKALKVDTEEFRVSEERQTGVRCEIPREEEAEYEKVYEHKNGDLKEKHEIEIEERDARSEIGSYENNGGDGREEGLVTAPDDGKSKSKDYHYPLRPDCNYYSPTDCKFNHPLIDKNQTKETEKKIEENKERRRRRRRKPTNETKKKKEENMDMHGPVEYKQPSKETKEKKEKHVEMHGPIDCKPTKETKKKKEENMDMHGPVEYKPSKETKEKKEKHVEMHGPIDCKQPAKETKKKKVENVEKQGPIECKPTMKTKKKKEKNMDVHGPVEGKPAKEEEEKKKKNVERHGLIECKQPVEETKKKREGNVEMHGPIGCKATKETKKKKVKNTESHGPIECKCHMSSAGCKHGKACKFNHGEGKNVKTPVIEYNFVGLPIRPGEKKCPYYMSKGFCQNGRTCRLHHPDPVADETGLI